jgi:pimeloyl-ACP methyl ester carboxylesterase
MRTDLRLPLLALLLAAATGCSTFRLGQNVERATVPPLERARAKWEQIARAEPGSRAAAIAAHEYRLALLDLARALPSRAGRDLPLLWDAPGGKVRIATGGPGIYDPRNFDDIRAGTDGPSNKAVPQARRTGLGATGIMVVNSSVLEKKRPGEPESGWISPATAIVDFDAPDGIPELRFYDPREVEAIRVRNRRIPLAADFARTAHAMFGNRAFLKMAISGLFNPEKWFPSAGLYLTEPYHPDRVPVILVHGLQSDPHVWENTAAAILADPALNQRVQLWYFAYPTGLPVPGSAARMRQALGKIREAYDPQGDDPAMRSMLMAGHSMGGLVTRMQVIDSGTEIYNAYFRKPPSEVFSTPYSQDQITRALIFDRRPEISRAVFICTPHHGSEIADWGIARLGAKLIRTPLSVVRLVTDLAQLDVDAINPQMLKFRNFGITSIDTLSPEHPYFKALAARPIRVPFHTIHGDRGKGGGTESSDGVVPYRSSHLPGAVSDLTLPYPHGCVERARTVEEIVRITRQHVGLN